MDIEVLDNLYYGLFIHSIPQIQNKTAYRNYEHEFVYTKRMIKMMVDVIKTSKYDQINHSFSS